MSAVKGPICETVDCWVSCGTVSETKGLQDLKVGHTRLPTLIFCHLLDR